MRRGGGKGVVAGWGWGGGKERITVEGSQRFLLSPLSGGTCSFCKPLSTTLLEPLESCRWEFWGREEESIYSLPGILGVFVERLLGSEVQKHILSLPLKAVQ